MNSDTITAFRDIIQVLDEDPGALGILISNRVDVGSVLDYAFRSHHDNPAKRLCEKYAHTGYADPVARHSAIAKMLEIDFGLEGAFPYDPDELTRVMADTRTPEKTFAWLRSTYRMRDAQEQLREAYPREITERLLRQHYGKRHDVAAYCVAQLYDMPNDKKSYSTVPGAFHGWVAKK